MFQPWRSSRCCSRFQSRSFMVSRLSCIFLPRASANSTFARPFPLKYIESGTSVSPCRVDRALEPGDFTVLEQELALPPWLMVQAVPVAVFGDVTVDQPYLVAFNRGIAFSDRTFAAAERFHFGAGELDSSLEPILNEIVEARPPVLGDDLLLVEWLGQRLGHGA